MIRFTCECGRLLQAPEEYAGKQAACPNCQRVNIVPTAEAPPRPVEAVQRSGPAPAPEAEKAAVQAERPERRDDYDDRDDEDGRRARGRRRRREDDDDSGRPPRTSGKAITSLVLGLSSVVCLLNIFTGLPAVILGAIALKEIGQNERRVGGRGLALGGIITGVLGLVVLFPTLLLVGLLFPAVSRVREAAARAQFEKETEERKKAEVSKVREEVSKVREAAARMQSSNNLKLMSIGLLNYHDANRGYPKRGAICSPDGRPLLSWRVAILPYIEQEGLYRQFRLDEAWDSPNNKRLLASIPKTYVVPGNRKTAPEGQTFYRAFIGRGAIFDPTLGRPTRIPDIMDGTSNTILIVEAADPIEWTRPDDLPFDPNGPLPAIGGHFSAGANAAFADGSVRLIPAKTPEATIRALITRNGGEAVSLP